VQTAPPSKQLYRVTEAMELLSLGRSVIYEQIRSGRLRTVKEGRTRLVPAWAITEYVSLLADEAGYAELEVAS
jgi:excisionase family DNA binding protein